MMVKHLKSMNKYFDFKWESTGIKANVKDPIYGKSYNFEIYKIESHNLEIQSVAGFKIVFGNLSIFTLV
jgi:hypothetical protein